MATEPIQVLYCPVCGQPKRSMTKKLYGVLTCRQCVDRFAQRRYFAWILDQVALQFFVVPIFAIGAVIAAEVLSSDALVEERINRTRLVVFLITYVAFFLLALKDGFNGYSPAKWLFGLRVYNRNTGTPATFFDSLARNWAPAMIPFFAFIVAMSVRRGQRLGDGVRNTKVVWLKYAKSPVFDVSPLPVAGATVSTAISEPLPEDGNPFRAPQG